VASFSTDGSAIIRRVPREIEVAEDAVRIRYSGLIRLFLGREVALYAEIESVEVGLRELLAAGTSSTSTNGTAP
jgi:hypothetical protein